MKHSPRIHIIKWTNGGTIIATGSLFPPVTCKGKDYEIAECNNCLVYPGIGLGCVLSRAERLSKEMVAAAAHGLTELSPALQDLDKALSADIKDIRETEY